MSRGRYRATLLGIVMRTSLPVSVSSTSGAFSVEPSGTAGLGPTGCHARVRERPARSDKFFRHAPGTRLSKDLLIWSHFARVFASDARQPRKGDVLVAAPGATRTSMNRLAFSINPFELGDSVLNRAWSRRDLPDRACG